MSHYLCRFVDEAGQVRGEVPIIGSSDHDAIEIARSMFRRRSESGGFELWLESRCLAKERPELRDWPARDPGPARA